MFTMSAKASPWLLFTTGIIVATSPVMAAGPKSVSATVPATIPYIGWSGLHLGFNGSLGGLFTDYSLAPKAGAHGIGAGASSGFGENRRDTSVLLGGNLGYDWHFGRFVIGAESDFEGAVVRREIEGGTAAGVPGLVRIRSEWVGSLRGRAGVAVDDVLLYATGGPAVSGTHLRIDAINGRRGAAETRLIPGYTVGAGFEARISPNFTAGVEYRLSNFGQGVYQLGVPAGVGTASAALAYQSHQVMGRLNWYPSGLQLESGAADDHFTLQGKDWSVHAQSTFIEQALPGFHSPYIGLNSLTPRQARETWTATAFLGIRLREGTEFYFNPETVQGFGPSGTLGLAGFSNGEAAKAGFVYPDLRPERYFIRQTFGFGGEQETVADTANQLAGTRDIDRLTITAGKVSITDIFDNNAYAHDPRVDFFNAAIFTSIAYDYPANLAGYTNGIIADFNQKDWAFRTGLFQVPEVAGSDALDFQPGRGGIISEFEARYAPMSRPGKLRVGAFDNRTFSGDYTASLASTDVNDGLVRSRRSRNKYGFYINAEQSVTDDLGVFSRYSWNDGRTEIVSYTDVDSSISAGISLKGTAWNRPSDVVGLAGAVNSLIPSHRQFLAAGGLGLLIGDGRLSYSNERILETYYAASLTKAVTISFDYQLIANPAYNADRGPVSIFSTRLHAEF